MSNPYANKRWDWKVRSYHGDRFMLETVHVGDHSKNEELAAIAACGRWATVTNLRTGEVTEVVQR